MRVALFLFVLFICGTSTAIGHGSGIQRGHIVACGGHYYYVINRLIDDTLTIRRIDPARLLEIYAEEDSSVVFDVSFSEFFMAEHQVPPQNKVELYAMQRIEIIVAQDQVERQVIVYEEGIPHLAPLSSLPSEMQIVSIELETDRGVKCGDSLKSLFFCTGLGRFFNPQE